MNNWKKCNRVFIILVFYGNVVVGTYLGLGHMVLLPTDCRCTEGLNTSHIDGLHSRPGTHTSCSNLKLDGIRDQI